MRKPLSVGQHFILSFDGSTGPWFTMNAVLDVRGPLDVRRLDQAFRDLVGRHDLLRTRIENGEQVIRPRVPAELELVDDWGIHAQVDFGRLSPVRLRLARIEPDRHMVCLHLHHVVADPVTLWGLVAELAALYRGLLPAPRTQFWRYAEDEARLLEAGRAAAEEWWSTFKDVSMFAQPSPTERDTFALRTRILDAARFTDLERVSRRHRSTTFITLLAGFACAMQPYLGPEEGVLVNTLFSRRNRPEWRTLPGPCNAPAYIVLPRPPARLTAEYVTAVRDVVLGAQKHILYRFADLHPAFEEAAGLSPFVEYLPDRRPPLLSFGAATGTVVDAAGPRDIGRAQALGIRARRTADGELFAHLSGNGVGWSRERTLAVCENLTTEGM